jgi:hypothetical protein
MSKLGNKIGVIDVLSIRGYKDTELTFNRRAARIRCPDLSSDIGHAKLAQIFSKGTPWATAQLIQLR